MVSKQSTGRRRHVLGALVLGVALAAGSAGATGAAGFSGAAKGAAAVSACIAPAAAFHSVNPLILRSILNIESGQNPSIVSKNTDGSLDVGAGGINSRHFTDLAKWGIAPNHLLDPCVSTYVSAWILSKKIRRHGNTWEGIASYHSVTPYHNRRYRILLHNDLVRTGVISGVRLPVPPLKPAPER